ncbi:hypothetical protein HPB52_000326 [Rhipicephalus sanguineus]|uniref:Uncharacterized protein n=1 Tax=Rhipicephalus sanguineus TaxID=34632 RepID=A0A9D4T4T1_RHISA|nr:hypothetical protein HPB52_000326 [Rhipicephalus sanguineus]
MPVALCDTLRGVRFADYVEVDTGASVCGALTDEDIIAQVAGAQPVAEEPEGEEDEDDEAPVRPSASAVMEALNVARLFFSFEEGHAQCWAEQLTVETPRRDPRCFRQGTEQQARPRSEMQYSCWQRRLRWWFAGTSTDGRVPWLEPGSPASDASARCLAYAAASARPQPPST